MLLVISARFKGMLFRLDIRVFLTICLDKPRSRLTINVVFLGFILRKVRAYYIVKSRICYIYYMVIKTGFEFYMPMSMQSDMIFNVNRS